MKYAKPIQRAYLYFCILLAGILCIGLIIHPTDAEGQAQTATRIKLNIRDQQTGFAIPNSTITIVETRTGLSTVLKAHPNGKAEFFMTNGHYTFLVTAKGYNDLKSAFQSSDEDQLAVDFYLDPKTASNHHESASLKGHTLSTKTILLTGYVGDENTGKPLQHVHVNAGTHSTTTDHNGFFAIDIAAEVLQTDERPNTIAIEFIKQGYITHKRKNFYLIPNEYILKVSLTPSNAKNRNKENIEEEVVYETHGFFDRTEDNNSHQPIDDASNNNRIDPSAASVTIPGTIRVGTNCQCRTCTNVIVMSLEAYVESGVDSEWIASWLAPSLEAGAVAYRSYGAWHISKPASTNYDIANTTCMQVWNSTIVTSTKNAAQATANKILIGTNGTIHRAEYSSENNGLNAPEGQGCGDGFAGIGTSGAPCIRDTRCKGRSRFGHGRGMCQYGSSFWAKDRTHVWILNHYYKPIGVSIATGVPALSQFVNNTAENRIALNDTQAPVISDEKLYVSFYPNPVSDQLIITYKSINSSNVEIKLFDVYGTEIAIIASGNTYPPGIREVRYDVTNLIPGLYYLKVFSHGTTSSEALIVSNP